MSRKIKLIDAQRYLGAAYMRSTKGPFFFQDLGNLRGRNIFQQAAQLLGYVKEVEGARQFIWVSADLFPTDLMAEQMLSKYLEIQVAHEEARARATEKGKSALPELDLGEQSPQAADLQSYSRYKKILEEIQGVRDNVREVRADIQMLWPALGKILANEVVIAEEFEVDLKYKSLKDSSKAKGSP
jgi:DNA repair ATPase RecN